MNALATRSRRAAAPVAAAALVLVPAAVPTASAAARPAASRCVAAARPRALDRGLEAAFRRAAALPASFRLRVTGSQHYGHCGTTRWAWAMVEPAPHQRITYRESVTLQDHSVVYRAPARGRWKNLPIGEICTRTGLPAAMAHAWHIRCP